MTSTLLNIEHRRMCCALKSTVDMNSKDAIIDLIIRYRSRIKELVMINTESILPNIPGCTLIHYIYRMDMVTAYEILLSFFQSTVKFRVLHSPNYMDQYPSEVATRTAKIHKFGLFGTKGVVNKIHLDLHLSDIVNSEVYKEYFKGYTEEYPILIVKLACIYGTVSTLTKALAMYMYSCNQFNYNLSSMLATKDELSMLANIGGNSISSISFAREFDFRSHHLVNNLMETMQTEI